MNNRKVMLGVGAGTAVAALLWINSRNQQREKLVQLLSEDPQIRLFQSATTIVAPPEGLQLLAQGKLMEIAEDRIRLTNIVSAEEAYLDIGEEVGEFIGELPQDMLSGLLNALGMKPETSARLINLINILAGDRRVQR